MPAQRVHAVVRILAGAVLALAFLAPAASAQSPVNATDDVMRADPTAVRDVLANDSGGTTDLRVASNTQPANGTATCSALGACFYKANAGYTGPDVFTYVARNGAGAEDIATVTINVVASSASSTLFARDDEAATIVNQAKTFNVTANDSGNDFRLVDNTQPKNGTVTCQPNGDCTYTPASGYTGSDGFRYTISEVGQKARVALGGPSGGGGSGRASADVHLLVAPADTGYRIGLSGSPNPVGPGGTVNWALGVFSNPEGISGQELRALSLPSASTGAPSGPHKLQSVKSAKGWSSTTGADGSVVTTAGNDALLGESLNQTFPKPLPPIRQGTGGDGHVPILVGSKVFAFYHHTDPTGVTCVDRTTGAICDGYPSNGKRLDFGDGNGFGTTDINGPGVVNGSKIWTHLENSNNYAESASIGLFCWDASTNSTCGLTIVDRVAGNEDPGASAPMLAGGKMWFGGDTGKLYCVDPGTGAVCDPLDTGLTPITTIQYYDAITHGNRVFVSRRGTGATCVDVVARAACPGWTNPIPDQSRWNLVNQKDASGNNIGACVFAAGDGTCYPDADPSNTVAITNFVNKDPYAQGYSHSLEAEIGSKTIVGSLSRNGLGCYDWSKTPTGPCTGGDYGNGAEPGWINRESNGSSLPSAYGAASDGSCVIGLGDPGQVFTIDPAGSSPCASLGSGTDKLTIDLRDQRCDGTVGSAAWRSVKLSDTNDTEMESVVVTVRDAATGEVLKSGEVVGGDQTLDLSGINTAAHPAITIDATAKSKAGSAAWDDSIPPRLRIIWKSDPRTACVVTKGDDACGSGTAALALVGTLRSPGSGSQEARVTMQRNACAGGVRGQQARSCGSKRRVLMTLRIERHLRKLKATKSQVKSVRVVVNGKRAKVFKRNGRWKARADLRRLRKGRYVVRITVTLKDGRKITGVRRYRTCRDAISGGPPRL